MSKVKIKGSVGIGGGNNRADIGAIQIALNERIKLISPAALLVVDKSLGKTPADIAKSKTVAAIMLFQKKVCHFTKPDGLISVDGTTHKKLNKTGKVVVRTPVKLTSAQLKILKAKLLKYEDNISHMYQDTRGKITIGIGHLIKNLNAAYSLTLYTAKGVKAKNSEIKTDFDNVGAKKKAMTAKRYKKSTKLTMKDKDILALRDKHIKSFSKELKRLYPDFGSYPSEVQLALFDMIFNLGMTKLRKYKELKKALNKDDWAKCAKESNRKGIPATRNKYVKDLFNKAAKKSKLKKAQKSKP